MLHRALRALLLIVCTAVLFCSSCIAFAQDLTSEGWQVRSWTTLDGLPQNSITDILQSSDGYIWLTTFGGVVRFDGTDFFVLNAVNTPGLTATRFTSVAQTPDGVLWFGSENRGLFRYEDGRAESVGERETVWDLALDGDALWAGTDNGVVRWRNGVSERMHAGLRLRKFSVSETMGIIATSIDMERVCLTKSCEALPSSPQELGVHNWSMDTRGRYIVGVGDGAYVYGDDGWQRIGGTSWKSYRPAEHIIWEGSDWVLHDAGMLEVATNRRIPLRTSVVPASDGTSITATWIDREGGLWIGTDGAGLLRLQDRDATIHNSNDTPVHSVVPTPDGTVLYVSTNRLFNLRGELVHPELKLGSVWPDGSGSFFAVDSPYKVLHREADGWRTVHEIVEEPEDYVHNGVRGPWFIRRGVLYFIPPEGMAQPKLQASDLDATSMRIVSSDADGHVWLTLDEKRLVEVVDSTVVRSIDLGSRGDIRDLLSQGERVWLASYGDGVLVVQGDAIIASITPQSGMCDFAVSHIFDSEDGQLWFNTNRGMARVSVAGLEAHVADPSLLVNCTMVLSGEGNGATGVRTADGHLWAPTIHGLAEVDPAAVAETPRPRLIFQQVQYGDHDLLGGAREVRGPDVLHVRFAGLHFRDPYGVRFRYRIGEPGGPWSALTNTRDLHISHLPPGIYTLEVQARGLSGGWSVPRDLTFVRMPLWWETRMAQVGLPVGLGVVLMCLLGMGLTLARRTNRELREQIRDRERAEADLRSQQEANAVVQRDLENSRRLGALGRLAGGVAHDFNNLLTVVSTHASLLSDYNDSGVTEIAGELLEVVDRATTLTRHLLVFGRQEHSEPTVLNLGAAVSSLVPVLRRVIREDIVLAVENDEPCGVRIDRGHLDQIVSNLVINSRDAIDGAGRILLRVGLDHDDPDVAQLTVQDDGRGLDPEVAERMFEPYYTTKALSRGTGLGLATVLGHVQLAGGGIDVESQRNVGTAVTINFPRQVLPEEQAALDVPTTTPTQRTLSVLLIDDHPEILRALARSIERLGWTVHTAIDLQQAVEVADHHALDVVISDVVMPEHAGPEVVSAILEVQPGIPVVYMTGHSDGLLVDHPIKHLLRKPFSRDQLLQTVVKALDEVGSSVDE